MDLQEVSQLVEDAVRLEKKNLVDNLEDLEKEQEHAVFLTEIANDYKRYQNIILTQKEKEKTQLLKILNYLDDLIETNAVTEYTLSHTQNEQKRLIHEIKEIQREMDKINIE